MRTGDASTSLSIISIADEIIFKQFKRMIVTTYLFKNTFFNSYLDFKQFKYIECKDVICRQETTKESIASNINFISKYDKKFKNLKLSASWFDSNITSIHFSLINNTIKNIGNSTGCKENSRNLGYTVPKSKLGKMSQAKSRVFVRGYSSEDCIVISDDGLEQSGASFIPCSARASNRYANKTTMVHVFNRFPNPTLTLYLSKYNIDYSNEAYALNELIQWVWRSAIRNNEKINLAILSERMRNLFTTWLEN